MRIPQAPTAKGSLKWMQAAANLRPDLLQPPDLPPLTWVSPLIDDGYAEYRDRAFLDRLGLSRHAGALADFWPARGPQWDGLARFDGGVLVAEAKAHLPELPGPACAARPRSKARIAASMARVQEGLGLGERDWLSSHYQYANRLAHLWWLRGLGIDAHLLLVGFLGDTEVRGPRDRAEWLAAYRVADRALGLPDRHALSPFVHHVFPDVARLSRAPVVARGPGSR